VNIYADTSWWLAYKCRGDLHHEKAIALFEQAPEARILWTPWHRLEVFNSFRQTEYAGLIGRGEARAIIRLLEQEVRLGYWQHVEFDWTETVRTACELSAEHSLNLTVRGMDLFHVAVAIEVAADTFLSFDEEQNVFACAVGFSLLRIKGRHRRK
jgi:predicted nucleic acid-binding protein